VLAYPDTDIGCEGGYCSWQSGLPALVSSGPDPIVSWNYNIWNAAPDSMWDALIDNEFSASCSGTNPASNANIAIYLDTSNPLTKLGLASGNLVWIDGQPWYTLHVRDVQGGIYDYKTEFAAARPTSWGVSGLDVGAFYTWVQNNDANWDYGSNHLPPTDCLQDIGTGFEPAPRAADLGCVSEGLRRFAGPFVHELGTSLDGQGLIHVVVPAAAMEVKPLKKPVGR
jgi:hypothetical protein